MGECVGPQQPDSFEASASSNGVHSESSRCFEDLMVMRKCYTCLRSTRTPVSSVEFMQSLAVPVGLWQKETVRIC